MAFEPTGIPPTLGPYRLIRSVGRGGMAQVFLCSKFGASGFERQYALKVLLAEHRGNAAYERLLIQEAKIGSLLHHRNLVHVHDLGVDGGIYYLCMDFVDGPNLGSLLPDRDGDAEPAIGSAPPAGAPLALPPIGVSLELVSQIAEALAYIHDLQDRRGRPLGLVHRDVTPGNIMLSRYGEVRLADFGLVKATRLEDSTWGRFRKGTVAYMSPEQIRGESLTQQSDQFGLGILLAELLGRHHPFDAPTPIEVMHRIQDGGQPDLQHLPDFARPLIHRMLRPQPAERFAGIAPIIQELARLRDRYPSRGTSGILAWMGASRAGEPSSGRESTVVEEIDP